MRRNLLHFYSKLRFDCIWLGENVHSRWTRAARGRWRKWTRRVVAAAEIKKVFFSVCGRGQQHHRSIRVFFCECAKKKPIFHLKRADDTNFHDETSSKQKGEKKKLSQSSFDTIRHNNRLCHKLVKPIHWPIETQLANSQQCSSRRVLAAAEKRPAINWSHTRERERAGTEVL